MLKNIFNPHLPLHFGYRNKKEEAKTEAMCQYDNVPISLRSPVESQKSKVKSRKSNDLKPDNYGAKLQSHPNY